MSQIRVRRTVDPDVFLPIDFGLARSRRYLDKASKTQKRFKHLKAITPRNIAKSYSSVAERTEIALTAWAHGDPNKKFLYLRRGKDEFDQAFPTIYKEVEEEFPDFQFRCRGEEWQAKPWDAPAASWRTIAYGMALIESYKRRSSVWSDVDYILFDEFIDDGSRPINNEVNRFESLYDTMARNRPVETLFMANPQFLTPGVMNPYFVKDGINVTAKMPEFVSLRPQSTLYWFPPEGKFGNQQVTDRQRELGKSEYAKMSYGGEFVHAQGIPVGKRGPRAEPICGLLLDGAWFSIWGDDDNLYAERGDNKSDMQRYAFSPQDIRAGVRLYNWSDPILNWVREEWRNGGILFKDTAVHASLQMMMVH